MNRRESLAALAAAGTFGALASADERGAGRQVRAKYLYATADDFMVDVWHNGAKIPDSRRTLLHEIFGATVERIDLDVAAGDWLVFNVVNNRLRWGGAHYFGLAGLVAEKEATFVSECESGRWSACEDPGQAPKFISVPGHLAMQPVQKIATPWDQGDERMRSVVGNWTGAPIWGAARNTWLKLRVA
ncbi:MAG TPA: hypothetical protein VNC50_13630 [Planctomycetia bacterium]|nr:hypothetical protein [Planctomycetia bacterium]